MIHILAVGQKMPKWVDSAVETYLTRMQTPYQVKLKAIAAAVRKNQHNACELEAKKILKSMPARCTPVALCVQGDMLDSHAFAGRVKEWVESARPPCFIIGGADGISPSLIEACPFQLSLSKLTYPHTLARILLSEQLYRSMALINNHPYHKGDALCD